MVEAVASLFRAHLRERKAFALCTITRAAPGSLVELGCGTGEIIASLPEECGIERYVGVDISSVAIAHAREQAKPIATFVESALDDIDPDDYADFDFVLALGLLPYLTDEEVDCLIRIVRGKSFLVDYHLAGPSLHNCMHWCYRQAAGHTFYRMHREEDIARLLRAHAVEDFDLVHHAGLAFVRHLKPAAVRSAQLQAPAEQ